MPKHENEYKEEAREKKGTLLDSVTMTIGTPAKGGSIALKCYVDMLDVSKEGELDTDTEIKVQNLFKLRELIKQKGFINE